MKCLDFDWQINEFMVYCRSTQLREKSMASYEQALRLFERWCAEELRIFTVDKVTEPVIRKHVNDLQARGKYTFYVTDQSKKRTTPNAEGTIASLSALPPSTVTSINIGIILAYYVSGLPMDLIHAAATVIFLFLAAEPMLEKLDRIKVKYGLVE